MLTIRVGLKLAREGVASKVTIPVTVTSKDDRESPLSFSNSEPIFARPGMSDGGHKKPMARSGHAGSESIHWCL